MHGIEKIRHTERQMSVIGKHRETRGRVLAADAPLIRAGVFIAIQCIAKNGKVFDAVKIIGTEPECLLREVQIWPR